MGFGTVALHCKQMYHSGEFVFPLLFSPTTITHCLQFTKTNTGMLQLSILLLSFHLVSLAAQEYETITSTIFVNNDFRFYVNGELIVEDPVPTAPHNAVNVTFRVVRGSKVVYAFEGIDLADDFSGLELGNRCLGNGGLRAVFSNRVVTDKNWVCSTYHYGPTNWKSCFAAQTVRNQSQQVLPNCLLDSTPSLIGCVTRVTEVPVGWTMDGFDDSRWEYALEYTDTDVGWGLEPNGCTDPGNPVISNQLDPNGVNMTCPRNVDWGTSKFIWRPDLDLDNRILCRLTVNSAANNQFSLLLLLISLLTVL